MAKKKISTELYSYGIYSRWDRQTKDLPKLIDITDQIPLELDVEFGYVIVFKGAKGKRIHYRIDHPPFKDDKGKVEPSFEGEYFINSNNYEFFLGDTIWAPIEDKKGEWCLSTYLEDKLIAKKTLFVK